jgi:leader peptidase (prepilin peptidase)/N-methyltransferase
MTTALMAIFGLALGKLADLLLPKAYRDTALTGPQHRCMTCGRSIGPRDLVPFAEALTAGRCTACRARLPIRWAALPVGVAAVGVICNLEFGQVDKALTGTVFGAVLLTLAFSDLERRLIPDRIVYPSIVAAGALAWIFPNVSLAGSVYGFGVALAIGGVLIAFSLPFGREAFGMGDAKLILLLGALLGPRQVVAAAFLAIVASGVLAIALLASRRVGRGAFLPLGPFLSLAGIAAMLWGIEIWDWWAG